MTEQIVLVTGASRGIGEAVLSALAAPDRILLGTATSQAGADSITEKLAEKKLPGKGLVLDVSKPDSVATLLDDIKQGFDQTPTILVNNAGITQDNLFLRMKPEQWQQVIDTNLTGVFHLTKACLRGMIKAHWGRIINISSVSGVMGNAGQCNYAAAKAGLVGFSKSLAREVGSRQVTVNVVAPGFVSTDMTKDLPTEQVQAMLEHTPIQRLAEPEEIAAAVAFLASDKAGYITGETIHVNGGMNMA